MKILITGDFCPINRFQIAISDNEVVNEIRKLTQNVDLAITNLECPLTDYKIPIKKTGPALKANQNMGQYIKSLGFNLVTLANNHTLDYGATGLKNTINYLEHNNIPYIGAGKGSQKFNPYFYECNGVKVAILNFCENEWSTEDYEGYSAAGYSEVDTFYAIKEAKEKANFVIVINHGGHEMYQLPSPRMKKSFHFMIDCGADVVVNHHTHCISGYEVYKEKPIFYSLGNFLFDNPSLQNSIWNFGMGINLDFSEHQINYDFVFFEQFNGNNFFKILDAKTKKNEINKLNQIIQSDELLGKEFNSFVNQKKKLFNSYLEPVKSSILLGLINRGIIPSFWNKRKRFYLKNLISCESHSEIVKEILKNETRHT